MAKLMIRATPKSIQFWLEACRREHHRRDRVSPDPVEHLYRFTQVRDREVVGLLVASLSYGRVQSIMKGTGLMLDLLGPSPATFLIQTNNARLAARLASFRYRVTSGPKLAQLLIAVKRVLTDYGSLEEPFRRGVSVGDETIRSGLEGLVAALLDRSDGPLDHLLPDPRRGSACKRLCLFMRWMLRHDELDPGGWKSASPAQLIVPLDTHVHRLALGFGWTRRSQPDLKAALEVTAALRAIAPRDPLRYDFAMVRASISNSQDAIPGRPVS